MPGQHILTVLENRRLNDAIFSLTLAGEELSKETLAGQFVHIKCHESSILRRPISVSLAENGIVTITAEIKGDGTRWLSQRRPGDQLDVLGPLGRGFCISPENIIAVGGGIGAAPMLLAARAVNVKTAILGFRNSSAVILADEFRASCKEVYINTDDGSVGEPGTVLLPLTRLLQKGGYGAVLACGPRPMLKAVAALTKEYNVPCQVSLEERMGCGVGACLVCSCEIEQRGRREMHRVCKDGPVFNATEVVW